MSGCYVDAEGIDFIPGPETKSFPKQGRAGIQDRTEMAIIKPVNVGP